MSGGNLRLQVVLQALDKASGPFRKILSGSKGATSALRDQQAALRKLQASQRDISAFHTLRTALKSTDNAMATARQRALDAGAAADRMRSQHLQLRSEVKSARRELTALPAALAKAKVPAEEIRTRYYELSQTLKVLEKRYDASASTMRNVVRSQKVAEHAAHRLSAAHKDQSSKLQALRAGFDRAGISTEDLGRRQRTLRSEIQSATQQMQRQQAVVANLARQQQSLARASQQAQSMRAAGASLAMGGALATGAGYGAGRLLGSLVGTGAAFDAEMSSVQALTRLAKSSEELAALRAQARQLGAMTSFTATDAAQGQGFLAMAGFTPEAIRAAMPALLDMAKAGRTELSRTADIGSNILSGFGLDPKEMGRVSDVLVTGFSTANTNLEMLGETMKYVAPIAKAAGVSLEESVAMAGLLGNVGIQSSQAGTTLRSMLLRLSAPAGKASAALAELNVQTRDSDGNMRGILDVTAEVAKAVERLGSGERLSYLKQIFGEEPAAGMAELIARAGSGEIEKYLAVLQNAEGSAAKVARVMDDNLAGSWKQFKSASEDVQISLTELLDGALRDVVTKLTLAARWTGDWIKQNPKLAASIAKIATGLTAVLIVGGALALSLGTLLGPLAMLRYLFHATGIHAGRAFSALGGALPTVLKTVRTLLPLLGGISLPLLAIGAAVLAVALLVWKYWGPIKAFMLGVWDGIAEVAGPAMDELKTALEPLAPVWDMVSGAMGKAWAWFKKLLSPFEATSEQLRGATDAGKGLGSVLGGVLAGGLRKAASVITTLMGAFKIILPILKNVFGGAWQYLQGAWSMIVGLFTGDGERIRSGLSLMWQGINNILMGWPEKMMQAGRDMLAGLSNGIIANAFVVREAIAGVANGAMDRFKGLLGINSPSRVFAQYGDFTMQGLAGGLQRSQSAPLQQVSGLGERMRQLGSGLALSAAIPAAAASPVMTPGTVAVGTADAAPVSYTINIHAPAGSDAQDIARLVRDAVAQIERDRNSRRASRLTD